MLFIEYTTLSSHVHYIHFNFYAVWVFHSKSSFYTTQREAFDLSQSKQICNQYNQTKVKQKETPVFHFFLLRLQTKTQIVSFTFCSFILFRPSEMNQQLHNADRNSIGSLFQLILLVLLLLSSLITRFRMIFIGMDVFTHEMLYYKA